MKQSPLAGSRTYKNTCERRAGQDGPRPMTGCQVFKHPHVAPAAFFRFSFIRQYLEFGTLGVDPGGESLDVAGEGVNPVAVALLPLLVRQHLEGEAQRGLHQVEPEELPVREQFRRMVGLKPRPFRETFTANS